MWKTDYAGIDYSLGQSNKDPETGIHYGVINQNSVPSWCFDEIMNNGTDESYLEWRQEILNDLHRSINVVLRDYGGDATEEQVEDFLDTIDLEYEPAECSAYSFRGEGLHLMSTTDGDIFVLKSDYYTHAQFCSPCAPGAGYLASSCENGPKTYCLPQDWFDEHNPCPYPVFSVKTGELLFNPESVAPSGN